MPDMLTKAKWPSSRSYRTGSDHEPIEFFLTAFGRAASLDLLLGYFSFSAIHVLSTGMAQFLVNGGRMRVVANNILSKRDKEAVAKAEEGLHIPSNLIDLEDIGSVKHSLDQYGLHFFECMAWLIRQKRLSLVIIKPKSGNGIAHYKEGLFSDGQDEVLFSGSCNFTASGLIENHEKLDVFLSWEDERSNRMIAEHKRDFECYYSRENELVEYVAIQDVEEVIVSEFGNKEINQLLTNEQELTRLRQGMLKNRRLKRVFAEAEESLQDLAFKPRFPFQGGPRDYQKDAYNNWLENNKKGVFAMATGTGKTITALNCILEEFRNSDDGTYQACILVPTITLVEQWEAEATAFNFQEIIKVSSKSKWERELATTLSVAKRVPTSFVVIATYATFRGDRFSKYVKLLPKDAIFIADEAHNLGAKSVLVRLGEVTLDKRIGLSATPKRKYDLEGSSAISTFFDNEGPFTYEFSMDRAIQEGILCQYDYHPHIVQLTADELREYAEITKILAKFFNPHSDMLDMSEVVERLLLKRKRVIHKAENKLEALMSILNKRYSEDGNLAFTFVYVPEGFVSDDTITVDDSTDFEENQRIISEYTEAIGRIDPKILVNQFVGGMKCRDEILNQFKNGQIQVLASMKCLDEGVDIPRAEHAIFCSSTGNPRQFIQRRGRILRKHPDKSKATIHDLVVVPDLTHSSTVSETFRLERNMVKTELERVMQFASLSMNPFETEATFKEVCEHYNLDIYTIHKEH